MLVEVFLPADVLFGAPPGRELEGEEYIQDIQHRLEEAHEYVSAKLQKASQNQIDTMTGRPMGSYLKLGI